MGLLGGGGGSVDVSAGVNAIQQGTQQGISAIQQYYADAVPALKDYFSQAQASIAPFTVSGSNAMDSLDDLMGVARPTSGAYSLSSALANESKLTAMQANDPMQQGWLDPSAINTPVTATGTPPPGTWQPGAQTIQQWNPEAQGGMHYGYVPATGEFFQGGEGMGAHDTDPSAVGLKLVKDPTTGQYTLQSLAHTPEALTADQQAQWNMIQQYHNGTLAMTDPSQMQATALQQLQSSPGYQFTLQQGLQGVDRSSAARGLLNSGAAVKGATDYASGLAQQTYNNRVSQLAGMAGAGQTAAGTAATLSGQLGTGLANAALGTGSNIASLYGSQAQGLAQLYAGQASANAQQGAAGMSGLFGLAGNLLGGLF